MNEQNPGGTTQSPPDPQPGSHHEQAGPRVSGEEIRDLSRLRRTRNDKYVAGVAGGLARHLDIDPVVLRVAFVVLSFFGGAGVLIYAACWLLVPQDGSDRATIDLDVRSRSIALIGAGAVATLALIGDAFGEGPGGWIAWPLVIVGAITWLVISNRDRRRAARAAGAVPPGYGPTGPPAYGASPTPGWVGAPAPTAGTTPEWTAPQYVAPPAPMRRPDRPRDPRKRGPVLFWFILALIALSLGVLGIADAAGGPVIPSAYPALALGIVAAGLLVGSIFGRAGGLIPLGLVFAVGLAGATAAQEFDGSSVHRTPQTAAGVQSTYDIGAGELLLDLTEVTDLAALDGRQLNLDGSIGRIEVRVPDGLDVTVDASVSAGGEIRSFGEVQDGWDISLVNSHDGGVDVPTLHLDLELELGEILVVNR